MSRLNLYAPLPERRRVPSILVDLLLMAFFFVLSYLTIWGILWAWGREDAIRSRELVEWRNP